MFRSVTSEEAKDYDKIVHLKIAGPNNTMLDATATLERLANKPLYRYSITIDGNNTRPFYYSCEQVRMAKSSGLVLDPFGHK